MTTINTAVVAILILAVMSLSFTVKGSDKKKTPVLLEPIVETIEPRLRSEITLENLDDCYLVPEGSQNEAFVVYTQQESLTMRDEALELKALVQERMAQPSP